jgi:hypothetical protein
MANNSFSKEERVFFEEVLEGFNPNNITAMQVDLYKTPSKMFERSDLTIHRPIPYVSITQEGLVKDPGDFQGMTQLTVPSTLNANATAPSDIKNVPFHMNTVELNDPIQREKKKRSAILSLSAKVDNSVATLIANEGTLFIADQATSGIKFYEQVAQCEEAMTIRDISLQDERTIIMNPSDYNRIAGDLADGRKVLTGHGEEAFVRSKIPGGIATFDAFKANFQPTIVAATAANYQVDGSQKHIPLSIDGNGNNVDNRSMLLTVKIGTGVKRGDAFTIAGINALSMIHKNDTGVLQTFRVLDVASPTSIRISPAIVTNAVTPTQAEKEYANCSNQAVDDVALVFINTVTAPSNIFWKKESVEIVHGSLSREELGGNTGVASMVGSTDSGLEILISRATSILDLETKYRLDMWFRPNVLNEQMCGVLVGKQT